jgi:hypothetical protein
MDPCAPNLLHWIKPPSNQRWRSNQAMFVCMLTWGEVVEVNREKRVVGRRPWDQPTPTCMWALPTWRGGFLLPSSECTKWWGHLDISTRTAHTHACCSPAWIACLLARLLAWSGGAKWLPVLAYLRDDGPVWWHPVFVHTWRPAIDKEMGLNCSPLTAIWINQSRKNRKIGVLELYFCTIRLVLMESFITLFSRLLCHLKWNETWMKHPLNGEFHSMVS